MKNKEKNFDHPDIDEQRMPVTKIIVKDLLRGKYREGHARPINWEAKPESPPPKKEQPTKKKKGILIGTAVIVATALSIFAIIKLTEREKTYQNNTPRNTQQFKDWNHPATVEKIFVQDAQTKQRNEPVFYQKPKNKKYYKGGKEKIYTWVEEGVPHYTNIEDVAISKNAVELQ